MGAPLPPEGCRHPAGRDQELSGPCSRVSKQLLPQACPGSAYEPEGNIWAVPLGYMQETLQEPLPDARCRRHGKLQPAAAHLCPGGGGRPKGQRATHLPGGRDSPGRQLTPPFPCS